MGSVLHRHDMYSPDGYGTPEDAALYASEIGLVGLAQTNHGTAAGLVRHYHACKERGIIPILGVEGYFMPEFDTAKYGRGYHITILCMDNTGYSNMCQMLSIAAEQHYYYQPIITWELLEQYNEGLIILSGCLGAIIPKLIVMDTISSSIEAEEWVIKFKNLLGDRFYGEVQCYEVKEGIQTVVNEVVIELCKRHDIHVVMTTDSHFIRPSDERTHNLMMSNWSHQDLTTYHNRHIASEAEMLTAWGDMMGYDGSEYIVWGDEIAYRCEGVNIEWPEVVPSLEWGEDSVKKLSNLCKEGLKAKGKYSGDENEKYRKRLAYEFNVIRRKHFVDYFLLCYDIYRYARSNNIRTNYGRGSVCGSLLAYALQITDTDPILFDIPFETFLREDKNTIPDIDMDFPRSRRGELMTYLLNKYDGKAAQISTYGYYKVKNLLNDLAKVLKVEDDDLTILKTEVSKLVTDDMASMLDHDAMYDMLIEDSTLYGLDTKYDNILLHFSKLFGQVRYIGKHAAGIAISEKPIDTVCPLIRTKNGIQTSYDLTDLGKVGVVKFDLLGLATLDAVSYCEELIGKQYNIYDILSDNDVLEDFRKGSTPGVFQFDSRAAKEFCVRVEPTSMDDIFALNALNRPGPLSFGFIEKYVDRKSGEDDILQYEQEIAPDTYGVFIYSDHIIKLCKWSGLTAQETDKLIKAVSKKTVHKVQDLADKMKKGLIEKGLREGEAEHVFSCLSLYGLKKAHAVGYGLLSYYTAYLKHYHPIEYFCALLRSEESEEKRVEYELEARNAGISVMIATVNGTADYSIINDSDGDVWIQKGLMSVKNVGDVAAYLIEEHKPYTSIGDMKAVLPRAKVNKRVYDALEENGCLLFEEKDIVQRSFRYNKSLPLQLKRLRSAAFKK